MPTPISTLLQANAGWLYYKRYYAKVDLSISDTKDVKNKQEMESINATLTKLKHVSCSDFFSVNKGNSCIDFYTDYPGLLTGSGYTHETGREGETKLGFFFDHTTGMPCLPGHSVKGMLRSYFPNWGNEKLPYKKEKQEYILDCLQNGSDISLPGLFEKYLSHIGLNSPIEYDQKLFITILEKNIFEGKVPKILANGKWEKVNGLYAYEPIGIYQRDIFHDAFINRGGKGNEFIGMDAITPHPHPLKNPNPLAFIKILPNVGFRFQFNLKDTLIPAKLKLELFIHLISEFGIGAKTNVGYGQLRYLDPLSVELGRTTTVLKRLEPKKLL